tara:strand:+ start:152 stop:763 length:612 start_codon:yes stop_codon:yes gene_type:complete
MFQFNQQNNIGKRGEQLFLDHFPSWSANNQVQCTEPDFVDNYGRKAEIKFDVSERARRDAQGKQLNFFMETISNDRRNTVGGIFRAQKEQVQFFVYIFEQPLRIFVMDVDKALQKTQELVSSGKYRQCRIRNPHYFTIGYPLPISEFKACMVTDIELNQPPTSNPAFSRLNAMKRRLECTLLNITPTKKDKKRNKKKGFKGRS